MFEKVDIEKVANLLEQSARREDELEKQIVSLQQERDMLKEAALKTETISVYSDTTPASENELGKEAVFLNDSREMGSIINSPSSPESQVMDGENSLVSWLNGN